MDFKITKVYADNNGDSHFEDVTVPLSDKGDIGFLSEAQKTKSIIFRKVKASYNFDFHPAPARQYIVLLDGEIEIETSLGIKRTFSQGDILLMEDTEGKGHRTKNLKPQIRSSLFIKI
ncbi:hypothetical protein ACFSKN_18610 [Mariniflexile gromovii]|uniref:Cupin 2 conserved barrel domain-containing protein n=1 Tax=Mariniflexile gromovii TaxID=362523 RepID=A0ABS4BUQ5_9FLAO|nr:hypothetical protein [Mariniflexile gromovii]MBP0904296.1 hypothetical protein [Mariniflexile gromovii]